MSTARFKLLLPKENTCGNLLWHNPTNPDEALELQILFEEISSKGFWCSLFPEGDGFCFATDSTGRIDNAKLTPEYYTATVNLFKAVFGEQLLCDTPYL